MLGGGGADLPVLPCPGFAAFLPVDGETRVRLRPVRQRGQLHEHRLLRWLAVDNQRLLTGATFPVIQQRRQTGTVIRMDVGEVDCVNIIDPTAALPECAGNGGAAVD